MIAAAVRITPIRLEAEGVSHTLVVALSEILRSEDSCARHASKDTEVIDKKKLIDDRNTGHLLGADLSYHDVVEKADKVGDTVLNHNRHRNAKHHQVKPFVPNKFSVFLHGFPLFLLYKINDINQTLLDFSRQAPNSNAYYTRFMFRKKDPFYLFLAF